MHRILIFCAKSARHAVTHGPLFLNNLISNLERDFCKTSKSQLKIEISIKWIWEEFGA